MSLVDHYDLKLYHMDMKIAFLNKNFEEDVYMVNLKAIQLEERNTPYVN